MIIDTHAHIFSSSGPFVAKARYRPAYDADFEQWLALRKQSGVTHGVLVQPSFLGTDNSLMLATLEQRPGDLRAVVVIDPSVGKMQLRQWQAAGVRGVRLNLLGIDDFSAFSGTEWARVFAWMVELGWHLEVQCEGERFADFLPMLPDLPLALVVDHFGLPDPDAPAACAGTQEILREAARRPVYVKLSAPYRLRGANPRRYAQLFLAELGPEKLLWGSDWPWTNHEQECSYAGCLQALYDSVPSPDARRMILQEVPKQLYGFGDPTPDL